MLELCPTSVQTLYESMGVSYLHGCNFTDTDCPTDIVPKIRKCEGKKLCGSLLCVPKRSKMQSYNHFQSYLAVPT